MWWLFCVGVIASGNPLDDASAVLESGLTISPWAKRRAPFEATGNTGRCDSSFPGIFGVRGSLWSSAYSQIVGGAKYIVQRKNEFYYFICDTEPSLEGSQFIFDGEYDVYSRCETGLSTSPTAAPTSAPVAVPTVVPTGVPSRPPSPICGPLNEDDCIGDWNQIPNRFRQCGGDPVCNLKYTRPIGEGGGTFSNVCPPCGEETSGFNNFFTTLPPTRAPTSRPTSAPTRYYGPMSEEECHSGGGYGWYNYTYIDNVASEYFNDSMAYTAVRYCCGLCSEFFDTFLTHRQDMIDRLVYSCACPAFETEIPIRNNNIMCTWPLDSQDLYPFPNPPNLSSITCGNVVSFTTLQPTFAPTLPPTVPRIGAPVCWEYDEEGCYSTGTWCTDGNFIAASNYTVNPIPFYTVMRAATIDEIEGVVDKSFLKYAGQQLLQANSIDTTCWCDSPSIDWLPYGMIPYAETRLEPVPTSIDVGAIPELPRAFHRGYTEGGLYLHTVGGIQLFGAVVNTNIGVTVGGSMKALLS